MQPRLQISIGRPSGDERVGKRVMRDGKKRSRFFTAAALALALSLPAGAAPPAAPWITQDIGSPPIAGSTDVDAAGVWTLTGSGVNPYPAYGTGDGTSDNFHFVYQKVKGDATLIARYQSTNMTTGFGRVGLMLRADDTRRSAFVHLNMNPVEGGFSWHSARLEPNRGVRMLPAGPRLARGLLLRLQRSGNEITGYSSRDGLLWVQSFDPIVLPALGEEALLGLNVASGTKDAKTAKWDQVQVQRQPEAQLVPGLKVCAGDRKVLLEWQPLKDAVGYTVYRGPAQATRDQLNQLNTDRVAGTSYSDAGEALVNGQALTYAVAAVFAGPNGQPVEGPLLAVAVEPAAVPAPWMGCGLQNGPSPGAAVYDPVKNQWTLRGTGWIETPLADGYYFLNQMVEGDFQIRVRIPEPPQSKNTVLGVAIRTSLHAGSACMSVETSLDGPKGGLWKVQRLAPGSYSAGANPLPQSSQSLKYPLVMRLTRQGNTLTADYSLDGGQTFLGPREATFDPPLPTALYAGPYVWAAEPGSANPVTGTATFDQVVITKP